MDLFDGYRIELRSEGDEFVAYPLELPTVSAFGATQIEALQALVEAYTAAKAAVERQGGSMPVPLDARSYSGHFSVRVPGDLHREIDLRARREKVALNAKVTQLLSAAIKLEAG